ncbi:MAG: hypothetical protein K9N23_23465 [Akkermansiaceae bacterium]|nr:hypothetical protein [Akkermansiaceae bacterium]
MRSKASIRLLAFSRAGVDLETIVTDGDGKPLLDQLLALPTQQLSPAKSVAVRALVFRSPKDATKVLGKVVLPAGREFILVFLPLPAGGATIYQINAAPTWPKMLANALTNANLTRKSSRSSQHC